MVVPSLIDRPYVCPTVDRPATVSEVCLDGERALIQQLVGLARIELVQVDELPDCCLVADAGLAGERVALVAGERLIDRGTDTLENGHH